LEDPVTGNLLVRQAISHAIHREEIIRYVLGDAAHPANSLLPTAHWARHQDLPVYRYDPEKAKELLQQAGISGTLHLTYKTTNNPLRLRLATVIQHQLAQVGIQAELRSYDWRGLESNYLIFFVMRFIAMRFRPRVPIEDVLKMHGLMN